MTRKYVKTLDDVKAALAREYLKQNREGTFYNVSYHKTRSGYVVVIG